MPSGWEVRSVQYARFKDGSGAFTRWAVYVDGRPRGSEFGEQARAGQHARRLAEADAVDAVLEAAIGQEYHYGIRVWPEPVPGRALPTWRKTDPHLGLRDYAFAWYSADPPPVYAYTRVQYERACAALELGPAPDSGLGGYGDAYGDFSLAEYAPRDVITMTLRRRRIAGLEREQAAAAGRRRQQLRDAGLDKKACTREEFEQACAIMGVPPLPDGTCVAVTSEAFSRQYSGVFAVSSVGSLASDEIVRKLCFARATTLEHEADAAGHHCDECGVIITGAGLAASFGLACSPEHYADMADRPGWYATRSSRR